MTAGSAFNPMAVSDVLPLYKSVSERLVEDYEYSGIYIVFDEFSKLINKYDIDMDEEVSLSYNPGNVLPVFIVVDGDKKNALPSTIVKVENKLIEETVNQEDINNEIQEEIDSCNNKIKVNQDKLDKDNIDLIVGGDLLNQINKYH